MRKVLLFILCLGVVFTGGCGKGSQEKVWLEAGIDNGVRSEFSTEATVFNIILNDAMSADDEKKMAYVSGEIEGFFRNPLTETGRTLSKSNVSSEIVDEVISSDLQKPLGDIYSGMKNYLMNINDNILKKGDMKRLNLKKGEFRRLSLLVSKFNVGNSGMFTDKKYVNEFVKTINEMKKIMDNSR